MARSSPALYLLRADLCRAPERTDARIRELVAQRGSVESAARELKIPVRTLYRIMHERGLIQPRARAVIE